MTADTTFISALTALAAVVLSPLATLLATRWQNRTSLDTTKREIAATVVSANRQKWIDELRNSIAAFQSLSGELLYRRTLGESGKWYDDPRFERVTELRFKIALLINPREEDHQNLLALVDRRLNLLSVAPAQEVSKEGQEISAELTSVAQKVLKREWERVKKEELLVEPGSVGSEIAKRDA
jgi:hypothetical protein